MNKTMKKNSDQTIKFITLFLITTIVVVVGVICLLAISPALLLAVVLMLITLIILYLVLSVTRPTKIGRKRLKVLYKFLEEKGIKELYLKRAKESDHEDFNMRCLIEMANDLNVPVAHLFFWGFEWKDTPEGAEYWPRFENQYRDYCEELQYKEYYES